MFYPGLVQLLALGGAFWKRYSVEDPDQRLSEVCAVGDVVRSGKSTNWKHDSGSLRLETVFSKQASH